MFTGKLNENYLSVIPENFLHCDMFIGVLKEIYLSVIPKRILHCDMFKGKLKKSSICDCGKKTFSYNVVE